MKNIIYIQKEHPVKVEEAFKQDPKPVRYDAMEDMPQWRAKNLFRALKIAGVEQSPADQESVPPGGTWRLTFTDENYQPLDVSDRFFQYHRIQVGDYFLMMEGSQAIIVGGKAFEDNFGPLDEP